MRPASRLPQFASERIEIVCLGSGSAMSSGRGYTSLLVDREILLDLSPTAVVQLHRMKLDPTLIEHIFVTHLHADHMFGLPFLLLEYCVRYERLEPLHIIGPPRLERFVNQACALAWPEMEKEGFRPHVPLVFTHVEKEGTYQAGSLQFYAVPMKHFGLDAFGYRFSRRGVTLAYTGDTGPGPQIPRLLQDVDVAVLELTHPCPSEDPGHLDVAEVAVLARRLIAQGAAVFATHIGGTPEEIPGVTLCEDGAVYYV